MHPKHWTYTRDHKGNEFSGRIRRADGLSIARIEMLPCDPPGSAHGADIAFREEERIGRVMAAADETRVALQRLTALVQWVRAIDCAGPKIDLGETMNREAEQAVAQAVAVLDKIEAGESV